MHKADELLRSLHVRLSVAAGVSQRWRRRGQRPHIRAAMERDHCPLWSPFSLAYLRKGVCTKVQL